MPPSTPATDSPNHIAPAPPLARSAGLSGAATLASRLLGVAREILFAAYFGAGDQMDAFYVAFRIPNLLRDLFAEGAMSAAFVPTFTRHLAQRGRESAWRLASQVLTALLLVTLACVVAGVVFATPIIRAYAGDYASVPGKLELTIRLTRIVLPFLTLVAVAAVLMGMLNSLHHYFVPSLSPAMFNVAMIVVRRRAGAGDGPRSAGRPITAVAIGALVGGVGQVAVQWPAARREGFRYRPALDMADPDLRQVLLLMGPGVVGVAATQVNLFVNTQLATSQGTGAASWLSYAFRLMYLPIGLFGVSIATATLPAVSRRGGARGSSGRPRDAVARAAADARAQRPGDRGPARPRDADRAPAVRARPVPAVGHRRHRRRAAAVRGGTRRLFDRPDRVAGLLRARPEPRAGDGERRSRSRRTSRPASRSSGRGDSARSRSPRRSPRSSMARRCSCCCAASSAASTDAASLAW